MSNYKNQAINYIEDSERRAVEVLATHGLSSVDVMDRIACVSDNAVLGTAGFTQLHNAMPNGVNIVSTPIRGFPDDYLLISIAADILAYCRYAKYECNPENGNLSDKSWAACLKELGRVEADPWLLSLLSAKIESARNALDYPSIRDEYFKKRQSNYRKGNNWYTTQVIDICKKIRRGNAPATQEEMFNSLAEWPESWIDSEKDRYGDIEITFTSEDNKPHHLQLSGFKAFEKMHRDKIGKKKI